LLAARVHKQYCCHVHGGVFMGVRPKSTPPASRHASYLSEGRHDVPSTQEKPVSALNVTFTVSCPVWADSAVSAVVKLDVQANQLVLPAQLATSSVNVDSCVYWNCRVVNEAGRTRCDQGSQPLLRHRLTVVWRPCTLTRFPATASQAESLLRHTYTMSQ
jgi:hypothetical protein